MKEYRYSGQQDINRLGRILKILMNRRIILFLLLISFLLSGCAVLELDVVGRWEESERFCKGRSVGCASIEFYADHSVIFTNVPESFFVSESFPDENDLNRIDFHATWEIIPINDPLDPGRLKIHTDDLDVFSRNRSFPLFFLYDKNTLILGLVDDVHVSFEQVLEIEMIDQ